MRAGRAARRTPFASALAVILSVGCGVGNPPAREAESASVPSGLGPVPDSLWASWVTDLSEAPGYFDTDNLISNEAGYLKVTGTLAALGLEGRAYIGVGPDQNFSYMAAIRPSLAFIVDIRRDNVLHHLLLKALLEGAPTRMEFLSLLLGRAPPVDANAWRERSIEEVVSRIDATPPDDATADAVLDATVDAVAAFGVPLDEEDLATVRRFHRAFVDAGLDLRFTSYGRPPRPHYPTLRRLILETDLSGRRASYLASERAYAAVRRMQVENRVVPLVADLAGPSGLRAVGALLRERGLEVGAVYTSNVEFYLWRGGTFEAWRENMASLPLADEAVVIRSYFPNTGRAHPSAVPGYFATQSLQPAAEVVRGGFTTYWDVVTRGILHLE